ncbi:hypothetical protein GQ53DRAFT_94216 [Thozetella sp. PMI_491]|nr:hypothetical protein GQ53DRAFT_94216 [Thozetella sp. PMI_491]
MVRRSVAISVTILACEMVWPSFDRIACSGHPLRASTFKYPHPHPGGRGEHSVREAVWPGKGVQLGAIDSPSRQTGSHIPFAYILSSLTGVLPDYPRTCVPSPPHQRS